MNVATIGGTNRGVQQLCLSTRKAAGSRLTAHISAVTSLERGQHTVRTPWGAATGTPHGVVASALCELCPIKCPISCCK